MTTPPASSTAPAAGPLRPRLAPWRERIAGTGEYQWVHLWSMPLRLMHWIAGAALVLLVITGALMARPGVMAGDPRWTFALQWVRLFHFGAAAALVMTAVVRTYWLFVGNRFERWSALFPIRPSNWINLWRMIRHYLLIQPEEAPHYLGHNPLQQLFATLTYGIALVMAITGFVLFGQANPGGVVDTVFGWMTPYLGGLPWVRAIHHALAWYFPLFIIIHVYLAVRSDFIERGGVVSSMLTGGRYVPKGEHYVDE